MIAILVLKVKMKSILEWKPKKRKLSKKINLHQISQYGKWLKMKKQMIKERKKSYKLILTWTI
jgi:hypothetical protein